MVMPTKMLHPDESVLGITPTDKISPNSFLDWIRDHIRKRKSVAIDRLQFEECRQEPNETFDQFFIRLKSVTACACLHKDCNDERMATRVIAGISDNEARKKLLAMDKFTTLFAAVDLCRAEEPVGKNEPMLHRKSTALVNLVGQKSGKN